MTQRTRGWGYRAQWGVSLASSGMSSSSLLCSPPTTTATLMCCPRYDSPLLSPADRLPLNAVSVTCNTPHCASASACLPFTGPTMWPNLGSPLGKSGLTIWPNLGSPLGQTWVHCLGKPGLTTWPNLGSCPVLALNTPPACELPLLTGVAPFTVPLGQHLTSCFKSPSL